MPPPRTAVTSDDLSDRDREILNFERQWWKYAGAKEPAVREKFDMSSTRYYQVLNALIDRPESLAADPLLVRRLRRLRAARQRLRSARRPASSLDHARTRTDQRGLGPAVAGGDPHHGRRGHGRGGVSWPPRAPDEQS